MGNAAMTVNFMEFFRKICRTYKYYKLRLLWLGSHGDEIETEFIPNLIRVKQTPTNLRRLKRIRKKENEELKKLFNN